MPDEFADIRKRVEAPMMTEVVFNGLSRRDLDNGAVLDEIARGLGLAAEVPRLLAAIDDLRQRIEAPAFQSSGEGLRDKVRELIDHVRGPSCERNEGVTDSMPSEQPEDDPIGMPPIPDSAKLAMEFLLWSLEQEGVSFTNGHTSCYWHLVSTLHQHIGKRDA